MKSGTDFLQYRTLNWLYCLLEVKATFIPDLRGSAASLLRCGRWSLNLVALVGVHSPCNKSFSAFCKCQVESPAPHSQVDICLPSKSCGPCTEGSCPFSGSLIWVYPPAICCMPFPFSLLFLSNKVLKHWGLGCSMQINTVQPKIAVVDLKRRQIQQIHALFFCLKCHQKHISCNTF